MLVLDKKHPKPETFGNGGIAITLKPGRPNSPQVDGALAMQAERLLLARAKLLQLPVSFYDPARDGDIEDKDAVTIKRPTIENIMGMSEEALFYTIQAVGGLKGARLGDYIKKRKTLLKATFAAFGYTLEEVRLAVPDPFPEPVPAAEPKAEKEK